MRLSNHIISYMILISCTSMIASADTQHALLIDAGSSGSRLHLFSWPARNFDTLPPPLSVPIESELACFGSVTPGIDKPAGQTALQQLIAQGKKCGPLQDAAIHASTPIFLMATAGMRILPAQQRDEALSAVRGVLRASGFLFREDAWARVISGEEEGVFGWLTVNYLLGGISSHGLNASAVVGALDMGGASAQVTFYVPSQNILANEYTAQLGSVLSARMYTHSYLYMGADQARHRLNQLVYLAGNTTNPCFNTFTYPYNTTVSGVAHAVGMWGSGDFRACAAALAPLMLKSTTCLTDPLPDTSSARAAALAGTVPPINPSAAGSTCAVNGVYQPPFNGTKFVAFSTYSYVATWLGLPPDATPATLALAGTQYCAKPMATVQKEHEGTPFEYLRDYCFQAAYAYAFLTTGLGMPDNYAGLHIAPAAQNDQFNWAAGAILAQANAMTYQYIDKALADAQASVDHFRNATYALIGVVGLGLLLVALYVTARCRDREVGGASAGYSPLPESQRRGSSGPAEISTINPV